MTAKKIKSAVTDSGREIVFDPEGKPGVSNLLTLISSFTGTDIPTLVAGYEGRGYGDLKSDAADAVLGFVTGFREQVSELMADPAELTRLMRQGADKARTTARPTLEAVYDRVGFVPLP